jgi:hypothetical protein
MQLLVTGQAKQRLPVAPYYPIQPVAGACAMGERDLGSGRRAGVHFMLNRHTHTHTYM